MSETSTNPALYDWNGRFGLPRFNAFANSDFEAAFPVALDEDRSDIDAIANNQDAPSFDNVIVPLEKSGFMLDRISSLFWNLMGSHSDDILRALERDIAPRLSRHMSETAANRSLFLKIDDLWQNRDQQNYSLEQTRVLERHWKRFVRSGAKLDDDQQKQLADLNAELAELGATFSQNILADESQWALPLSDGTELDGLPGFLLSAMRQSAREKGLEQEYCVTLSRSIIEPFLMFSNRRDLRETAFTAWTMRGENGGDTDNQVHVARIVDLRQQKADLLGYASFAAFKLEDQMAKEPDNVANLLNQVWEKALEKAGQEEVELAGLIARDGGNHPVMPWDWRHYSEKLRSEKFDYDATQLKPYFALDSMINAAFDVANRLFGVTFEEHTDIELYHPDVRLFGVKDRDGQQQALFLADYFARSSKRSGAWMSEFQSQHKLTNNDGSTGSKPIIVNVMNFAKAPDGEKTLLSLDDARTLFHEFGHALHGMLSDVTYPSVSGTSVARDFVELPSQVFEHWLMVPEILKKYARHIETNEPISDALLEKVITADTFNAGFEAVEFTASALVDMAFHTPQISDKTNIKAFENSVLQALGMPDSITMRHRTPHFAHVFSGDGYSAGYYSYMWSEVLDADAFSAFEEKGDPFNPELAKRLHQHIYSAGGSVDPEVTYKAFRGKMPTPQAMMEKRGLA